MIAVFIGFFTLLILSYFMLLPMTGKQTMVDRTDTGLRNAIDKFKHLKDESQNLGQSNLNT
jgi:hypothetical protein